MQHKTTNPEEFFVRCNGGHPETGHPAVFLDLTKTEQISCPYCGTVYKKKEND